MKTGIIITGVAALASAAPAIPSAKGSSMQNATAMNPPVNGAQDGAWQVGCEKGNMDHENHQCSSFKGAAKGYTPSEYDAPAHPKYEPSTSQAAYSKPTAHGPPKYTSSHPAYEPSTTQAAYQKPTSYDSLKPSSTHAAYGKPPAYGPQKSSSTPADSKPTAHGPPEFTWAHPEYEPSSTTVNPYAKPSPSYGRRDGYGSPQHAPLHTHQKLHTAVSQQDHMAVNQQEHTAVSQKAHTAVSQKVWRAGSQKIHMVASHRPLLHLHFAILSSQSALTATSTLRIAILATSSSSAERRSNAPTMASDRP
ncbi:hypothetical protein GQ44DRAFT_500163 [Phaeosphaeriaceae sp. PMI808]|nr:hypothetical protein GQ44DRAFT_500163 [Phaeosphaeriaceae sp. PMI808]